MKRSLRSARVTEVENRYSVRLEDEPSPVDGIENRERQKEMLRAVANNPGMMDCGSLRFQTLKMFHDGEKWVIELEAVGQ
jgi:hypothetical protein